MLLGLLRLITGWLHKPEHEKYARPAVEALGLVLAVCIGIAVHRHYVPRVEVVKTNEHTTTVTVEKPVLSERTILKYLPDPKDKTVIEDLLAENARLKLDVVSLTNTVADLKSTGGGAIITEPPAKPGDPVNYHFKDYRLDFTTDLVKANYELNQKFVVLTSTGKDQAGQRTTLVTVYEEGPNGERRPLQADTTAVVANEAAPRWFTHLNVQGGLGITTDTAQQTVSGGLVGVQWLKRGSTYAPADTTWAVATPVMFLSSTVKEPGVLPVSWNLGRLPHQPFTNVWLSPYVGVNLAGRSVSRVGIVLSSTF